jgi:hypothetical protein
METKIRRIKGEIRQRMIELRDYYRDALESLRDGGHEPGTEIFRGWLEAKLRDAERSIVDLSPKTLSPNFAKGSAPVTVMMVETDAPEAIKGIEILPR